MSEELKRYVAGRVKGGCSLHDDENPQLTLWQLSAITGLSVAALKKILQS